MVKHASLEGTQDLCLHPEHGQLFSGQQYAVFQGMMTLNPFVYVTGPCSALPSLPSTSGKALGGCAYSTSQDVTLLVVSKWSQPPNRVPTPAASIFSSTPGGVRFWDTRMQKPC